MRTILFATIIGLATAAAGSAMAEGGRRLPGPGEVASQSIRTGLEDLGYRVSHVEAEHGRIELRAVNDTGLTVKLTYDPVTGEMLRASLR